MEFLKHLFSKKKNYPSVNEFRFCFFPADYNFDDCESVDDLYIQIAERVYLNLSLRPINAIKEVILSPYMSNQKRKQIREYLSEMYPCLESRIKDSKINLKND